MQSLAPQRPFPRELRPAHLPPQCNRRQKSGASPPPSSKARDRASQFFTSLEVTIVLGIGRPAARRRTSASGRVHEVAMVQRSGGRALQRSFRAPGSNTTPSRSSISLRSTSRSSRSISELGRSSRMVVRLGRPCAICTTASGLKAVFEPPTDAKLGPRQEWNRSGRRPNQTAGRYSGSQSSHLLYIGGR
jgi:hypothetical protein